MQNYVLPEGEEMLPVLLQLTVWSMCWTKWKRSWLCTVVLMLCCGAAHADLLIRNVTLIDGTGRPAIVGVSVLVESDRIQARYDWWKPVRSHTC